MAVLIFWTGLRLQLNYQTIYHFWFTIKLLLAKSIMFSFVEYIIFVIFLLQLKKSYLLTMQNEWRCIVLTVSVEGWIKRMLIQGWWAERHMDFTRKIGWVVNCLKWNEMVWALLFTLGWLSTHSINIMHLHPIKIQSNKFTFFPPTYHPNNKPSTKNNTQITVLFHHFLTNFFLCLNFEMDKYHHKVPFAMRMRTEFHHPLPTDQNLPKVLAAAHGLKIHSKEVMFL